MLLFTNGDAVAQGLRQAGVRAEIYPWRDVLHEGPVPALDLTRQSEQRARWLGAMGWGEARQIGKFFARRDAALVKSKRHKRTELWFEHDLYDQLQLLQIFGELAVRGADPRRYALICIDRFPGVDDFRGLGQLDADQLASLRDQSTAVTAEQLDLARRAWDAVRQPEPIAFAELAGQLGSDAPLPFLGAALRRWLGQFPEIGTGLDRVERLILEAVAERTRSMLELFRVVSEREPVPYLGDQPFYGYVARLEQADPPLLTARQQDFPQPATYVQLTESGSRCLAGELDLATTTGWRRVIGGVELAATDTAGGARWRFDLDRETVVGA